MTARIAFINHFEVFLIFLKHDKGNYISETETGARMSINDALQLMCQTGSEYRAIRFDPKSLSGEDVTTELAEHWMAENPELICEHFAGTSKSDVVPKFVFDSDVFEACDQECAPDCLGARELGIGQYL